MYIADLHIHSRFSRATSRDCDAPHLDFWARRKGIRLIGTGDFTHPLWRSELKEQLVSCGNGLYTLRPDLRLDGIAPGEDPYFVVTGEISSIYKKDGKTRKVHNVILLPGLEEADELSARLEAIGNIRSDGRPILGLDSRDLLELTLETCDDAELIPAHIWTPHFSMFGAFSGFDSIQACFGDMTPHIHAAETGLSSDPPMNWRVSALDGLTLVSNSDAHSPSRLGREANLLDTDLSYSGLMEGIRRGNGFLGTIEFFPEEGKYHLDGHRNCGVCLTPRETLKKDGICPVCGKKLTIGVEHRVEELADRPDGFRPAGAKPFECLAPLSEVIGASLGISPTGKKAAQLYEHLLSSLGSEFSILRQAPEEEIAKQGGPCLAEGIRRLRLGQVERQPGFDGKYGTISLLTPDEIRQFSGQLSLFGIKAPKAKQSKSHEPLREKKEVKGESEPAPRPEKENPQQQAAVSVSCPRAAIIAGPGTGKTKTLVSRIAYLVEQLGVKPSQITAVTFTNQAAAEMRQRLQERLGGKRAVSSMTIGTFHAICLKLLGKVCLISPAEALTIASRLLKDFSEPLDPKTFLQAVSRIKNGLPAENAELDRDLYEAYCRLLHDQGALDFDDLLTEALKADPSGQKCFQYLLVDEFQDINPVQYALVKHWNSAGKSLFVIGDPDQSIYGFRGASGRCFQMLSEDFPDIQQIRLVENYRSSPEILNAAVSVIEKHPGPSRLLAPNRPAGIPVRLVEAPDDFSEAVFIAKEIGRITGGTDMLEAQKLGWDRQVRAFSDIAVLCRTHRQLQLIETCLIHDDIPCIVHGREDFLSSDQVRGPLAFFRSLAAPDDAAALETALSLLWNCPFDLIEKAIGLWAEKQPPDPEALKEKVKGYGHLEAWLKRAEEWLPLLDKEKPRKLIERWEKEYGSCGPLDKLKHTAVFYTTFQTLWDALVLGEEGDLSRACGRGWESGAVRLMTLHGAKGLEFPAVFVAGATSGFLPLETKSGLSDPLEERRLFYVGLTRAKEELIITCGQPPSPFTRDLPEGIVRETIRRRQNVAFEQLTLF